MNEKNKAVFSSLSEKAQQALASLALEGITPSDDLMNDIISFDKGEIAEAEFIQRVTSRATKSNA